MRHHHGDAPLVVPEGRLDEVVLAAVARHDPDRPAIVDAEAGRTLLYGELPDQVARLATALSDAGLVPGDVVAVHLPNGIEFAVSLLAASSAGLTVAPVAVSDSPSEMRRQLVACRAAGLVTHADLSATWAPVACDLGLARGRLVVVGDGAPPAPDSTPYAVALRTAPRPLDPDVDPARRAACLPQSSGTTGVPKPIILTDRALVANAAQFTAAVDLPATTTLACLPFSHSYALTTTVIGGLLRGDTLVTLRRFRLEAATRAIAEHAVTLVFVVPPIGGVLASHPDVDPDALRSLRTIVSGSAALHPAVAHAMCNRLGVEVLQGYGLTEMAPITHVMRPGADMPVDSVGIAVPGVEWRVVDPETGRPIAPPAGPAPSDPGELLVRGPNAMLGYLGATDDDPCLDADGWVHTGDLVTVDGAGILRIVDRLKEMLTSRGVLVAPTELESLLREYPGVADAAVTGVRGRDDDDERPFALVVRTPSVGGGPSEEGLMRYVMDRTAAPKHLAGVAFVECVPRSDSGKVLRRRLADLLPDDVVAAR